MGIEILTMDYLNICDLFVHPVFYKLKTFCAAKIYSCRKRLGREQYQCVAGSELVKLEYIYYIRAEMILLVLSVSLQFQFKSFSVQIVEAFSSGIPRLESVLRHWKNSCTMLQMTLFLTMLY